jgi:hypothetical protein
MDHRDAAETAFQEVPGDLHPRPAIVDADERRREPARRPAHQADDRLLHPQRLLQPGACHRAEQHDPAGEVGAKLPQQLVLPLGILLRVA